MVPTNIIHNKSVKYPESLQPFLERNDMLSFSNIIFQCFEHHKYSIYFHHMWVAGRNHRDRYLKASADQTIQYTTRWENYLSKWGILKYYHYEEWAYLGKCRTSRKTLPFRSKDLNFPLTHQPKHKLLFSIFLSLDVLVFNIRQTYLLGLFSVLWG